ncbi:hypothetical protein EK904_000959, partial [Melospiza melodia maxima]
HRNIEKNPFLDTASQFCSSCLLQQHNLCSRLQQHSSKCQSLVKPSLETGSLYAHRKSHSLGKVVKGEQTSCEGSPRAESCKKNLSASLDPEGLQVLLETDLGGAQRNVCVAMCGTPTEVCVSITSHPGDKEFRPGQQLSAKSVQVNNSDVKCSKESEEVSHSRSPAGRRTAAVGSSQPNPLGTPAEEGFNEHSDVDCVNMSREGRRNKYSCQSSRWNLEADGPLEQPEECSVERSAKEPWCCEEGSQTQRTVPREISESSFWSLKVNEQSFWHFCDKQILARCFQAWRRYILWKRAATQLYRHQLLQKGFGALQGIVHQRRTQLEVAQQRHASALLAASFQRWKEAMAKQSQKKALQPEPYSYTQGPSAGIFGVGRLATMTTPAQHQLPAGYSKEVEQAHRMEGELWTQLRRRQRGDEFCWGVEAIRDMRRLAAAFRLWRLQKELLSKEEARLLEARALLEKKKLQNIFWMWHSQSLEMKKILTLTTQIQRNLVSRCFSTWKETAEQKALDRCNLAHLRAVSLRKHFQQWVGMLQALEQCKLRKALKLWHQKYLMLKTIEQSSKHLHRAVYEEPLAMLFSEDLSTSSGFDSSAPATLTSQSSLEKDYTSDSSVRSCWQQAEQHCLQRCFMVWSAQTQPHVKAQQHCRRVRLSRCLVTWAQVTASHLRQREALSYFKRIREHRLLVGSFIKWRDKLWRAEQVPGGRKHKWQEPSPGKACHRWRVAARGQRALRLGSVTTVKQACNYWTRAAAFSQCLRQHSTLIAPAAADGKGLEGVETKILAKLCGAESSGAGSQEPPVSGLWEVVAAHSIPV